MNHKIIFTLLIGAALLISTASAADSNITLSFQDVSGLLVQDVRVFDDSGTLITTANTTGTLTLDYNESSFYILQIQPQGANTAPSTLLTSAFAMFGQYWYYVVVLLFILILLKRR